MSFSLADPAAESGMQEVAVVSGAGSPANAPLPKLPSWSATGWQTLLKQPSAGARCLGYALGFATLLYLFYVVRFAYLPPRPSVVLQRI